MGLPRGFTAYRLLHQRLPFRGKGKNFFNKTILSIEFIDYYCTQILDTMDSSTILLASVVPAFVFFAGLEYFMAYRKGKTDLFSYSGSIVNISVGIAERLLNLFITGGFYALYDYIYEHFALFSIPSYWWVWIILLLTTDLVWYWYHRLGHEINLFWGAHIVHHQSEEFNYTVSARITTLQAIVRNLFWCVLPLIGFEPVMVIAILVVHGTYSFFTHTQIIGKLGVLEYVLITPSHHGVHHAANEKYLNKNYGDIFVFWDKLFGTFQVEEEKPYFGLTHPLKRESFLWQHFHYYFELAEACRRSKSFIQSIKIIFGKPESLDQDIRLELEQKLLPAKKEFKSNFQFKAYLNIQIIGSLIGLILFTITYPQLDALQKALGVGFILITLVNCGALLEQHKWIFHLEIIRVQILCAALGYWLQSPGIFIIGLIAVQVLSDLNPVKRRYFQFLYQEAKG